ncbi:hypothetical protein PILCRDRAFT_823698 [Piloderma croceum F 1598]|uniref:Uncharacterized protein n=1 Tax=Piloderma croceum (strain F 1598) TaxID=765440 RepID=A0A0C3AYQ0_PILCF|nr:hypothetical protein PILCRDRAFT_823698 [Piloderma croceum F 1598]
MHNGYDIVRDANAIFDERFNAWAARIVRGRCSGNSRNGRSRIFAYILDRYVCRNGSDWCCALRTVVYPSESL